RGRASRGQDPDRGRVVEDVGDQRNRAGHGGGEEDEPRDREPGGREDDSPLVLGAELDAVVGGGGDQAGGGAGRQQQRDEVDRPLEARDVREALVERDDEQEREQH